MAGWGGVGYFWNLLKVQRGGVSEEDGGGGGHRGGEGVCGGRGGQGAKHFYPEQMVCSLVACPLPWQEERDHNCDPFHAVVVA